MKIESPCASLTSGTTIPATGYRSHGNEQWEFNQAGVMHRREASINDVPIREEERKYHWPLGARPKDHPGMSDLGL